MRALLNPLRSADDVFEIAVSTSTEAQSLAVHLRQSPLAEDVVAGLSSVAVRFHPDHFEQVKDWLSQVKRAPDEAVKAPEMIELDIQYGGVNGPDFDHVCAALGLSSSAFIEAHTAPLHTVEMIGFTPGFSYISGLPNGMVIPRLAEPRPRVRAGSVGLSSGCTGIYALAGPGGWPLIGHTEAALFNPDRSDPFLLQPGQPVKFRAV